MLIGVLAGLATGALWGLTFIAPLAVEPFTPWDLTVVRYEIFGLASLGLMLWPRFRPTGIPRRLSAIGFGLGAIGYTGYVTGIFFSVRLSGIAIPPLVVGVAPILLALLAKRDHASLPWSALAPSLALIAAGLMLVNGEALLSPGSAGRDDVVHGVLWAVFSLVVWVVYAKLNADIMRSAEAPDALRWTGVQGIGAAVGSLFLLPWTSLQAPRDALALALSPAGPHFLLWASVMGIGGSWIATVCWVVASARLPLGIASQLIVGETVFGLVYGFVYEARWPTLFEGTGALLQLAGVVTAVAIFAARQRRDADPPDRTIVHRAPGR